MLTDYRINLRRELQINILSPLSDEDTNLRDISIIMHAGCGEGVTWELAFELSKRLDISYDDITTALIDIFYKFSTMDSESAEIEYEMFPKPSDDFFNNRWGD